MVLTEAFAAGTTVVASDIAGYRDVVTDDVDGVLVPPADAQALAEALRDLHDEPERRRALAVQAAVTVERFAWERVAEQVMEAYTDAIASRQPKPGRQRVAVRLGLEPADLKPRVPAMRLPSLEYERAATAGRRRSARRAAPPRRDGRDQPRWPVPRLSRVAEDRYRPHHPRADQLEPDVCPARPGGDVLGDGRPRVLLARDPEGRATESADQTRRRDAGHDDRGLDVLDAAGPPRRAGARARGRAPHRPASGEPANRARHAGVADAPEPARARDPCRSDVLVGRFLQRPPERADRGRGGARSAARVPTADADRAPSRARCKPFHSSSSDARSRQPQCSGGCRPGCRYSGIRGLA